VPVGLSPAEVVQFLDSVAAPHHRTILRTCYAAGLRISEAVHLTLAAVDSHRMVLRIEQGKGQQDRSVMLSPKLLEILREGWRRRRPRPITPMRPSPQRGQSRSDRPVRAS
jgi:integrase